MLGTLDNELRTNTIIWRVEHNKSIYLTSEDKSVYTPECGYHWGIKIRQDHPASKATGYNNRIDQLDNSNRDPSDNNKSGSTIIYVAALTSDYCERDLFRDSSDDRVSVSREFWMHGISIDHLLNAVWVVANAFPENSDVSTTKK